MAILGKIGGAITGLISGLKRGPAAISAAPVFRAPIGAGLTPQQQAQARQITGLERAATTKAISAPSPALRAFSRQLAQPTGGRTVTQAVQPQVQAPEPTQAIAQLPVNYQDLYNQAYQFLQQSFNQGQIINQNVEITPERAAEFLRIAEAEANPFFKTQFKLAREGFLAELGFQVEEIKRLEQETERQYAKSLRELSEQQAETGFALSGRRLRAEQELAGETQRGIEERRRRLQFGAERAAGKFAEAFGEQGIRETAVPALPEAPQVRPGEEAFKRGQRTLPLYELSPEVFAGLIGEQEKERKLGIRSLAQFREELFRQGRGIPRLQEIRELKL